MKSAAMRAIAWLSCGCGKLPLCAAAVLLLSARLVPTLGGERPMPAAEGEVSLSTLPADFGVIDSVLAARAPELGLTLRQQLALSISEEAHKAGYDPLLILAVIDVESDFDDEAVSNRGARGLMQIRPSTLRFLAFKQGLRLTAAELQADPAVQVRLGIRYLRELHSKFGDLDFALMAYNAGPARLRRAIRAKDLEPFRRYPLLVRKDYQRFREGQGLGSDWALADRGG